MDKIEKLKKLKEALRQADANIGFEEITIDTDIVKNNDKQKIKIKGDYNGKKTAGMII